MIIYVGADYMHTSHDYIIYFAQKHFDSFLIYTYGLGQHHMISVPIQLHCNDVIHSVH